MTKVSIIVPVYNNEKYLKECLESLTNQTLTDIEIICINDGSEDKSGNILEEFKNKDDRFIVINQENQGVSVARNYGLKIAKGEYVGFVDSDDYIDLDYYEKLYNNAKEHNADIAACSIERFSPGRKRIHLKMENVITTDNINKKLELCQAPSKSYTVNKIYKKSELDRNNLSFMEGVFYEDVRFTIRALYYLKTLVTVPNILYHYRKNLNSIVKTISDKKNQDMINAREDVINFANEHNIYFKHSPGSYIIRRKKYNLLGLTLMKVVEYKTMKQYYLFSRFLVFEIRTYV